jgi:hypothetical protein
MQQTAPTSGIDDLRLQINDAMSQAILSTQLQRMRCRKQTSLTDQALFITDNFASIQQQIELDARPVEKLTAQTRQTQACRARKARERRHCRGLLRQDGQCVRDAGEHRGITKTRFVQEIVVRHEGQVAASQPTATDPTTSTTTVRITRILRRVSAPLASAIRSAQLQNTLLIEGYGA